MRKILIDCDTGEDDAVAISLALAADDRLCVLGISTCMGNLEIEQTFRNTLQLLTYLGRDIEVAKGSENPLTRNRWVGKTGEQRLEIPDLPQETIEPSKLDAVDFLAKKLMESETQVTLIPLAPLTNIAKLIMYYPDLVREKVDEIILMGGGMDFGNTTGAAELNFYADPEAAQSVFSFGKPVVMVGLDVCCRGYFTKEECQEIGMMKSRYAKACYNMIKIGFEHHEKSIMYDCLTVIYALHPEIFSHVMADVQIEINSLLCNGASICDTRSGMFSSDKPKIHKIILDVDRKAFVKEVMDILKRKENM